MEGITIQIFGSKDCDRCVAQIKAFEYHSIPFQYFDADAPENQDRCDKNKVDELPHIQAIYDDNQKVFHTHIGYISPTVFVEKMREHTQYLEEFFKVNKNIAQQRVDISSIKKVINEQASRPCSSCGRKDKTQ